MKPLRGGDPLWSYTFIIYFSVCPPPLSGSIMLEWEALLLPPVEGLWERSIESIQSGACLPYKSSKCALMFWSLLAAKLSYDHSVWSKDTNRLPCIFTEKLQIIFERWVYATISISGTLFPLPVVYDTVTEWHYILLK